MFQSNTVKDQPELVLAPGRRGSGPEQNRKSFFVVKFKKLSVEQIAHQNFPVKTFI